MKKLINRFLFWVIGGNLLPVKSMPNFIDNGLISDVKLQKVPNLNSAIAFSLLAIRERKKLNASLGASGKPPKPLTIEINLTNIYSFEGNGIKYLNK